MPSCRAAGRFTELRMHDLRFRPAESVVFFTDLSGLDLDEESAATLDRTVEAGPAGLRLASLSLRSSVDLEAAIAAIANSRGNIMDYLFSETFASLPEGRQEWLLQIAVLDQFCGPLCAALCAQTEEGVDFSAGQSFIAWLQAANLFLVPLDDQGAWFRFHHLFLQLLRYRQQALCDSDAAAILASPVQPPGLRVQAGMRMRFSMHLPQALWSKRWRLSTRHDRQ